MTTPQNGTQKVPTSTTPQIGNYDNVRTMKYHRDVITCEDAMTSSDDTS